MKATEAFARMQELVKRVDSGIVPGSKAAAIHSLKEESYELIRALVEDKSVVLTPR